MKCFYQFLFALIVACFLCRQAAADNRPPVAERFPEARLGSRFSYVDGVFSLKCNQWEVKETRKNGDIVSQCGGNSMAVTADGNPVMAVNDKGEVVSRLTPFLPQLSFPLSVGRTWAGKYEGQEGRFKKWSGEMTCVAAAFEPVQVPAGKFDAFRIECVNEVRILFLQRTIKTTNWYAPSVGMIVKSVNEDRKWDYQLAAAGANADAAR